jgi:PPOX class probable FMN-dependent enzyme
MSIIDSVAALEACYPEPAVPSSIAKQVGRLTPHYRALIEASTFVVLATSGPDGLDNSPRGDGPGFVRIIDDETLVMPDRRGDNRLRSLRNILADPRVALLFLIPNVGVTLRVNGRAVISADPELLASFGHRDAPATALIIMVESASFQGARSAIKAGLWNPVTWGNPEHLPSRQEMLDAFSAAQTLEKERVLERA